MLSRRRAAESARVSPTSARALTFVAVRQQEREPESSCHCPPPRRGIVEDHLRAVGEISELRLPAHQRFRIVAAEAVLVTHGRRSDRGCRGSRECRSPCQVASGTCSRSVLVIDPHRLALIERPSAGCPGRRSARACLPIPEAERERFRHPPSIGCCALPHLEPSSALGQPWESENPSGACVIACAMRFKASSGATRSRRSSSSGHGRPRTGPQYAGSFRNTGFSFISRSAANSRSSSLSIDVRNALRLVSCAPICSAYDSQSIGRSAISDTEPAGVVVGSYQPRCGRSAESDQVDHHIASERVPVVERDARRRELRIQVLAVDVQDRNRQPKRDVGAIARRVGRHRLGRESIRCSRPRGRSAHRESRIAAKFSVSAAMPCPAKAASPCTAIEQALASVRRRPVALPSPSRVHFFQPPAPRLPGGSDSDTR
jgi:hypothetical protein